MFRVRLFHRNPCALIQVYSNPNGEGNKYLVFTTFTLKIYSHSTFYTLQFFFSRDKNLINQSSFHHHRISHGREVIIFLRFRNAISQYERDSIALQLRQSRATPYIHDTKEGREEKEQGSKRKRKIIRAGVSRWLSPPPLEILLKLGSISVNTTQSFRVDLRGDITTIVPPPFTYYPPHNFASIREDNLG